MRLISFVYHSLVSCKLYLPFTVQCLTLVVSADEDFQPTEQMSDVAEEYDSSVASSSDESGGDGEEGKKTKKAKKPKKEKKPAKVYKLPHIVNVDVGDMQ